MWWIPFHGECSPLLLKKKMEDSFPLPTGSMQIPWLVLDATYLAELISHDPPVQCPFTLRSISNLPGLHTLSSYALGAPSSRLGDKDLCVSDFLRKCSQEKRVRGWGMQDGEEWDCRWAPMEGTPASSHGGALGGCYFLAFALPWEQELDFCTLRGLSYWLRAAQGQVESQALWAFHVGRPSDSWHLRMSSEQSHRYISYEQNRAKAREGCTEVVGGISVSVTSSPPACAAVWQVPPSTSQYHGK